MEDPVIRDYIMGGGCMALGLSGWLLPYRWNLLRLRGEFAQSVSYKMARYLPRILGCVLFLLGVAVMLQTRH